MKHLLLKVTFRSVVRIGAPGRDDQSVQESIPADQLFSWLSLGWIQLFGATSFSKDVLSPFFNSHFPWVHTDLFPYAQETIWLPTPKLPSKWNNNSDVAAQRLDKKEYKHWMRWTQFFESILEHKPITKESLGVPVSLEMLSNVHILKEQGKDNVPYYTAVIAASRTNGDDSQIACTSFAGILRCFSSELEEKLDQVCQFMTGFGMGGGRSSGLGTIAAATLEELPEQFSIPAAASPQGGYILLSPCCPTAKMIEDLRSSAPGSNSYSISSRAGWVYDESGRATNIRKPTVRSFDTGAIFSIKPDGRLVPVGTEEHPSFRYGVPFYIEA